MFVFAMSLRHLRPAQQPQTLSRMALAMLSLATGLSITVASLPGVPGGAALAQSGVEQPALSVEAARAAANRILTAVKSLDANLRFRDRKSVV